MKKKIKIITGLSPEDLENQVNEFIKGETIIDMMFSFNTNTFLAFITYENKELSEVVVIEHFV